MILLFFCSANANPAAKNVHLFRKKTVHRFHGQQAAMCSMIQRSRQLSVHLISLRRSRMAATKYPPPTNTLAQRNGGLYESGEQGPLPSASNIKVCRIRGILSAPIPSHTPHRAIGRRRIRFSPANAVRSCFPRSLQELPGKPCVQVAEHHGPQGPAASLEPHIST